MDAQGAGFAFTNADMDFSHVFDTVPQQQQVSMKPTGGETSGFFFGDEGVDTAASFIDAAVFSNTSQQATYAAQALVVQLRVKRFVREATSHSSPTSSRYIAHEKYRFWITPLGPLQHGTAR
jgi:hypothetical protein